MSTLIRNAGFGPVTLPIPLKGVLQPGAAVISTLSEEQIVESFGGQVPSGVKLVETDIAGPIPTGLEGDISHHGINSFTDSTAIAGPTVTTGTYSGGQGDLAVATRIDLDGFSGRFMRINDECVWSLRLDMQASGAGDANMAAEIQLAFPSGARPTSNLIAGDLRGQVLGPLGQIIVEADAFNTNLRLQWTWGMPVPSATGAYSGTIHYFVRS